MPPTLTTISLNICLCCGQFMQANGGSVSQPVCVAFACDALVCLCLLQPTSTEGYRGQHLRPCCKMRPYLLPRPAWTTHGYCCTANCKTMPCHHAPPPVTATLCPIIGVFDLAVPLTCVKSTARERMGRCRWACKQIYADIGHNVNGPRKEDHNSPWAVQELMWC